MEREPGLLIADVDVVSKALCSRIAGILDCKLVSATSQEDVLAELDKKEIAVVLLDADTICDTIGLLGRVKQKSARIEVVIAHEQATIAAAVEAVKAGATDYLEKPFETDVLERVLVEAFKRYRGFQVPTLDQLERQAIDLALLQADGNRIEAARLLSIGKTTLYRKLRQYGNHAPKRRGRPPGRMQTM